MCYYFVVARHLLPSQWGVSGFCLVCRNGRQIINSDVHVGVITRNHLDALLCTVRRKNGSPRDAGWLYAVAYGMLKTTVLDIPPGIQPQRRRTVQGWSVVELSFSPEAAALETVFDVCTQQ